MAYTPSFSPTSSMWSESVLGGSGVRPTILQLRLENPKDLYLAYIPLFKEGGLFIPTNRPYQLGEDLYGLLSLPDDTQRHPLVGTVAWITPADCPHNRPQGVGVRFSADERGAALKTKIETALGPLLLSRQSNHTVA